MSNQRFTYLKTNIAYGLFNTPIKMPPLNMEELKLMRGASIRFNSLSPKRLKLILLEIMSFTGLKIKKLKRGP